MRRPGKTTSQMLHAPHGSVFVWLNGQLDYPKRIAQRIGRDDLRFVSLEMVRRGALRGLRLTGLVVDHAAHPEKQTAQALDDAIAYCRRPNLAHHEH